MHVDDEGTLTLKFPAYATITSLSLPAFWHLLMHMISLTTTRNTDIIVGGINQKRPLKVFVVNEYRANSSIQPWSGRSQILSTKFSDGTLIYAARVVNEETGIFTARGREPVMFTQGESI